MWHKKTIPLNGKRARFFSKTATNLLDGLGRPFTSSGGKNVQWIATWGNLNYLPHTFPFSRTVRLPMLHLRRVKVKQILIVNWWKSLQIEVNGLFILRVSGKFFRLSYEQKHVITYREFIYKLTSSMLNYMYVVFEMWCYRRVLDKIGNRLMMREMVQRWKLHFFGHVIRRKGLERTIITGKVNRKRKRGRPPTSWLKDIKSSTGMTLQEAVRAAEDREIWRRIMKTTASQHLTEEEECCLFQNWG